MLLFQNTSLLNNTMTQHTSTTRADYLIVGGGLAGCVVAWMLLERGHSCIVADEPTQSRASRIGAGIINPISGKRYSSIWNSVETFPIATRFYEALEAFFHDDFLRELLTLRLFASEEERAFWQEKRASAQDFARLVEDNDIPSGIRHICGGLEYQSWHVDTERVVERLREHFASIGALWEEMFDESALKFSQTNVLYKHIVAEKIIFCNGWKAHQSLLWRHPSGINFLSPAKGELLTVELSEGAPTLDRLLVQGVFLLPMPDGTLKIGATYEWDDLTDTASEAAQEELLQAAQAIFPAQMQVVRHVAGVRTAARDSKPILGIHPKHHNAAILNGFGAKGAVYAPFAAHCIIACLEDGEAIPKELALARFFGRI